MSTEAIAEVINPTQAPAQLSAAEIRGEFIKFSSRVKAVKEYYDALCIASVNTTGAISAYDRAVKGEAAAATGYENAKKASNVEGESATFQTQTNEKIAHREHKNAVDKLSLAAANLKTVHGAFAASKEKIGSAFKNKLNEIAGKRKQPESTAAPAAEEAGKRVRFGLTRS